MIDGDAILGYVMALGWLALFIYLPASDIRRAGSLRAWLRQCGCEPVGSAASVLIWAGCSALMLWMLTGGAVSVKLALLAPAGFILAVLNHRSRSARKR